MNKQLLGRLLRCSCLLALSFLVACSEMAPIKIGFVDSLTGAAADLGSANLNGVRMAVKKWNAQGGINGRKVELVIKDDLQNPDTARRVVKELIAENVAAIIGHGTSNMSVATAPIANDAKVVMMSPTTTTKLLTDKYDYFFRVISSTQPYAEKMASFRFNVLNERRVSVAYDAHNAAYSKSWLDDFKAAFERQGGKVSFITSFDVTKSMLSTDKLAQQLLAGKPDGVLLITNFQHAGLISKAIRERDRKINIGTSEWAATEGLTSFGCDCIGGIYSSQFIDRDSTRLPYINFKAEFVRAYGAEPGFGGVTGHEAANVIFESLRQKQANEDLRQAILRVSTFKGLQSDVVFNGSTTASRPSYITTIINRKFRTYEH